VPDFRIGRAAHGFQDDEDIVWLVDVAMHVDLLSRSFYLVA
jgi:hypothetical protein